VPTRTDQGHGPGAKWTHRTPVDRERHLEVVRGPDREGALVLRAILTGRLRRVPAAELRPGTSWSRGWLPAAVDSPAGEGIAGPMDAFTRLERMLRPPAGGIHTVSTGSEAQRALQRRLLGAADDDDILPRWRESLRRLPSARAVILGIPSDVGAGFVRGASFGPQAIREALLGAPALADPRVVDLGDVLVVPQLLHDDMLSEAQLARTRAALHGDGAEPWPVSPLSVAEAVLRQVRELAPDAAPLVLGGDHSVAWPALAAVAAGREASLGILHFDAHTDLLEDRLGVPFCFATWAFHANELVGRGQRLQQVGLRISRHPRAHWERTLDVRQYWMGARGLRLQRHRRHRPRLRRRHRHRGAGRARPRGGACADPRGDRRLSAVGLGPGGGRPAGRRGGARRARAHPRHRPALRRGPAGGLARAPGRAVSRVRGFVGTSLDGFLAGPADELDFLGPRPGAEDTFTPFLDGIGAVLMGRRTHDVVAALPGAPWPYGDRPVLVATSRPLGPAQPTVRAVSGSIPSLVAAARRAAGDRDVYLDGGALVRSALEAGLVDELTCTVVPVALGRGRPLLAGLAGRLELALAGARPIGGGMVELRYVLPAR